MLKNKNPKTKIAKKLTFFSGLAVLANLLIPGISLGQTDMEISVTRTPYLSFLTFPDSFTFGAQTVNSADANYFSNTNGGTNRLISIRDTRNSGGFTLTAQSSGDFEEITIPTNTLAVSNLRMISTTALTTFVDGTNTGNVIYESGYTGTPSAPATQTVIPPLNATSTNFATVTPFDEVEGLTNNRLNSAVTILNGCLTASEGRNGIMTVGLAYNLTVPKYTLPGEYATTITYTITDNTPASC